MQSNKTLKVLIPVLILLAIGGMWLLKNPPVKTPAATPPPALAQAEQSAATATIAPPSAATSLAVSAFASAPADTKATADTSAQPAAVASATPPQAAATAGGQATALTAKALSPQDNPDFSLHAETLDMQKMFSYGLPVIVDFGASWCGPCQQMAPALEAVNAQTRSKAIVRFVDVDKYPAAVGDYPVQLIPTQFFFTADGKPYVPSQDANLGLRLTTYNHQDTGAHALTAHQGGLTQEQMLAILRDMGAQL